ncbi:MAG: type II secretion system F family protein [Stappiaceae bacterium]
MFSDQLLLFAVVGLIVISAGAFAYVLLQPKISGDEKRDARVKQASISRAEQIKSGRANQDIGKRRKNIQDTLGEIEKKQQAKAKNNTNPPLAMRLQQAGLSWSKNTFYLFSVGCSVALCVFSLIMQYPIYVTVGLTLAGLLGVPRWYVNRRRKKRRLAFLEELPNAVDVIVRGVKSGLPLGDCLQMIASEAKEPVKSEFAALVESQKVGLSLSEAVARLPESMPIQEANFFAIVISIQSQAGGNLSEALGNLSNVLRERKKMKGKIQAMSMEAKASAGIIGALPIVVMGIVSLTSPDYISPLFTEPTGNIILGVSGFWMFSGVMIMKKMINFDV